MKLPCFMWSKLQVLSRPFVREEVEVSDGRVDQVIAVIYCIYLVCLAEASRLFHQEEISSLFSWSCDVMFRLLCFKGAKRPYGPAGWQFVPRMSRSLLDLAPSVVSLAGPKSAFHLNHHSPH